jgi:hypothetical protein
VERCSAWSNNSTYWWLRRYSAVPTETSIWLSSVSIKVWAAASVPNEPEPYAKTKLR